MSESNFAPGAQSSQELTVEIELTISAKCLTNKDVLSKSDPMCIIYSQLPNSSSWSELGRTEVIKNTLNPEFATKILVAYRFEEIQKLKFKIYDIDGYSPVLEHHDFLGEAECSLGQIVSSDNFVIPLQHLTNKNKGQLCIKAQEIGLLKQEVELVLGVQDLKKRFFFSKPDPFLTIYKENTLVHRTPFLKNNCNPEWTRLIVPMHALCTKKALDTNLLLQCWNYNDNGKHRMLGEVQVTTKDILKSPCTMNLTKNKKSRQVTGKLLIKEVLVKQTYSFLDYIMAGTQLNCTIAIDFTASNGNPTTPGSLHYLGSSPTPYEQALQSVVSIIQDYDSDKQFPVLGFGAKVPPLGTVSHDFYVNMSSSPYCAGVGGVIEAYRRCLPLVQLHGPTNFAPVINHVMQFAASYPNGDHYFILLILTDGAISDMADTKEAIIAASHLPVSIIIVGIGNADFASMSELDSDKNCLQVGNKCASRDIVQFVPFRDFLYHQDPLCASQELAKALLAELPKQLVTFMKSRNILPNSSS